MKVKMIVFKILFLGASLLPALSNSAPDPGAARLDVTIEVEGTKQQQVNFPKYDMLLNMLRLSRMAVFTNTPSPPLPPTQNQSHAPSSHVIGQDHCQADQKWCCLGSGCRSCCSSDHMCWVTTITREGTCRPCEWHIHKWCCYDNPSDLTPASYDR